MSKCNNCTNNQHLTKTIEDFTRNPEQIGICHRCYQDECSHSVRTEVSAGGKEYCAKCGLVNP